MILEREKLGGREGKGGREREREREREKETDTETNIDVRENIKWLPPIHAPTRDQTHNLGTWADWGSSPCPFGSRDNAPTH